MYDLLDLQKRNKKVKFVEPLWFYNLKQFLKGVWNAFKLALLAVFGIIFFYLFVFAILSLPVGKDYSQWKGKEASKKIYNKEHKNYSQKIAD